MFSKRVCLLLCFVFLYLSAILAQPKCYFEHYGSAEGLPQHSVMDILQDRNGFMWFATWDGLCKFDGYNFKTYRILDSKEELTRSNRIEHIDEDSNGYIWVTLPYEKEPLRFDPKTETFMGLRSLKGFSDSRFLGKRAITTKSGKVWFVSDQTGCICVLDKNFNVEVYNKSNRRIRTDKVYDAYEDSRGNSWLLTNDGLYMVAADDNKKVTEQVVGSEKEESNKAQSFYSVFELKSEIWFGSDRGHVWIYNKHNGQFKLLDTHSTSAIRIIKGIDENQIVFISESDGFFIYHRASDKLVHYTTENLPNMRTNVIHSCYLDKDKKLWLELDCTGVALFNTETHKLKHYEAKVETAISNVYPPNFFVLEDKNGRTWVHPRGGGFSLYDSTRDRLIPFYNEPQSTDWRFSNMLHIAFSDQQGNLWLGTRSQGLDKVIFDNEIFKTRIIDPNIHSTANNDVRCIYLDSDKRMWVSTKLGKTFVYDKNRKLLGYICRDGSIGNGIPLSGTCYSIMEDTRKNIWIGTKGEGLYRLTPEQGNAKYRISQYKSSNNDLYSLTGNSIYSIFQDSKNRIWIGTYGTGGLNLFDDAQGGQFINVKNQLKNYPAQGAQIRAISSDKYGNICVGTTLGLIMFSPEFENPESIEYKIYTRGSDGRSLNASDIYDICTTRKGETYLATFGGGLSKIEKVDKKGFPTGFVSYTIRDGLPSNVLLTIVDDRHSNLWIASEGNITKFDTQKKVFETYSGVSRMVSGETFSEGSRCLADSGMVYFGYSKGLIYLDPDRVSNNTFKPYVALTRFQIGNKDVPIGGNSPLQENIDDQAYIKLNHKQNLINIEFVALDYVDPSRIIYAYKLEGFDKDWIVTQNQRIANYTNLSPGKYQFKVRSTNSDGVWMDNERTVDIEITPSFWQTGWAYLLYVILFVALVYVILRVLFVFFRLQDKIKLEKEQAEMKIRFFTDISHEIRTPLTMIVSPVENILYNNQLEDGVKSQLQLVLKNTNRMIRMVNQILDFRKVQKQKFKLQKTPIGAYVEEICNGFIEISHEKRIDLRISNEAGDILLWIDRDNFEKLLFNLLSNAFKYTPEGKTIEVIVRPVKENSIEVMVKDEGYGMTREIQTKLFVRFASFNKDKSKPSTGIGLSIVKEVADRHHARISVSSEVDRGSSFSVFFPRGLDHFRDDPNVELVYNENAEIEIGLPGRNLTEAEMTESDPELESDLLANILIAEDDPDLRHFLKAMLSPHYNVIEAADGKIGYDLAVSHIPDFIISDLMMPEIDGLEFLQKIRSKTETSHIPFILLTAKSDIESKLSGLEYGADDYITKPFSVNYLKARIANIIRQRKALFENYTGNKSPEPKEKSRVNNDPVITSQDEGFILKVRDEIYNNMDDSTFLIDDLASAMAMSRTVFFKKLKSLTGQAPVDFIRDIRMNRAAEFLVETNYTIKEIAYMVGISDTKYFTQCFKKKFEMPPSEYRNKIRTKED
ncbi:hybrid sensor histidine kinase/response regulator transcription factor [Dysgonomonas macrotermitis]|uniref:histidine kinase n=1 Tax=Dysgonomonas macrotermitis TaxID=1346286 RepID=A0A1M4TIB2_9BACT|nr:hybrid sensor histidine kinase/response regulator transcription factor [Dysgonomonas macrotermitis]SHE44158.1 Two component regulator propeller [Dysgonomonas macrotermitis]